MKFRQYYEKVVYGYFEFEADNIEQAEEYVDFVEEDEDLDMKLWAKTEGWIRGELDENN